MVSIPTFITDEAQGISDFVRTKRVTGVLRDVQIERGSRPIPSGRRQGQIRASAVFKLDGITELIQEDGTTPDATEWSVRYDYSEWDQSNARPRPPERRSDWFSFVVPWFMEHEVNLNNPDDIAARLNKTWTFELQTFERDYQVQARDSSNELLWERAPGTLAEDDEGEPAMIQAQAFIVLPVEVPSMGATTEEAEARARELWEKHGEDTSAFKAEAIDDPIISEVQSVRRAIQRGNWSPE